MIRILVYLALLTALAAGFAWLADQPGSLAVTWGNYVYQVRPHIALALVIVLIVVVNLILWLLKTLLRLPSRLARRAERRREKKGREALSQGMIAVGAGDGRLAQRASLEATKRLGEEPLTLMLAAQTAQLAGNRPAAEALFARMAARSDTSLLGLRGLHLEARRRGDGEAAYRFAAAAQAKAALPWAGQAVLDFHAGQGDWSAAIAAVEANERQKLIDRDGADRLRAVLMTAMALDKADKDADGALDLAREAVKLAPGLVPAAALAGRLSSRKGNLRQGARILEAAWKLGPHPDLAAAYVDLRPGDAAADRLARAQALERLVPGDPESRLTLARAALECRDFALARATIAPLLDSRAGERPSVRMCLLMADIEETEHGASGAVREWLTRASRARRDKAWIADGVVSDRWAPASPSGRLDAFVWEAPAERLSAAEAMPAPPVTLVPLPPATEMIPPEPVAETQADTGLSANVVTLTPAPGPSRASGESEARAASAASAPRAFSAGARPDAAARRPALYSVSAAPDDPGPETSSK